VGGGNTTGAPIPVKKRFVTKWYFTDLSEFSVFNFKLRDV
jgi:hypothetical protein